MAYGYGYGGYMGGPGYYPPPVPDQLAQLRQAQYQQAAQPMMQQAQAPLAGQNPLTMNVSNNGSGIIWVNGEKEVNDFLIAPNNAVALWDRNAPVVYVKQADATGKPTTEIYDLVKRVPTSQVVPQSATQNQIEYVTMDQFNKLRDNYESLKSDLYDLKNRSINNKEQLTGDNDDG